jgi:hypothetical protein
MRLLTFNEYIQRREDDTKISRPTANYGIRLFRLPSDSED